MYQHSCATITPVFALAWHGTASLFGYFRPDQAPPTFILITSWFAPGFCSPSFFPSERFPTVDAWEPHLCPLVYSCSRFATRILLYIYIYFFFLSFLPLLSASLSLSRRMQSSNAFSRRSRLDGTDNDSFSLLPSNAIPEDRGFAAKSYPPIVRTTLPITTNR